MKKIVIASDSFKGTISSTEICDTAKNAIAEIFPGCIAVTVPVADGGEGTVECFLHAADSRPHYVNVTGPVGEPVDAVFAVMGDTAIIEMASAAGLPLLKGERYPLTASTYGVGMLIREAIKIGCKRILLGLGGSATTDCGCGMAAALGAVFTDKNGKQFIPTGGTLCEVDHIDISSIVSSLNGISVTAMCDVDNPLFGERGAAYIYGPQKGANPEQIELLDSGLRHISDVISDSLCKDISCLPGAGAAGGCGAGCVAFLGGELCSGTKAILDAVGFDELIKDADLVITGEGRLDNQSLMGKLIDGVSARTKTAGVPLIALVGKNDADEDAIYSHGISSVFTTNRSGLTFQELVPRALSDYDATLRDILHLLKATVK